MPPLDTQTQEPDVEQAAQQQDLQDQYERQQAGITPGVTPASFQRTAPGVYTPVPDTVPAPATGLPTTGITPKPAQSRRAPSISDLEKLPTTAVYGFDQQEAPPKDSFTSDLGHYLGGTLQNWGGSALGFGKFLNDATIDSPGLRDKLDSWTAGFAKGSESQFAKMSPSAQNAARADILRTFNIGPDTDEQGNHIPSPFEAGIGTYLAQRLAPIIAPAAALYFLPEGAVAVTAEIATALLFGSMTAGEGYNKVSDLVNKLPDAELRKQSEPYEAFRAGGASIDEAKGKLKVSTWSSVLATFAAGTAAGFGFGKVLQPGASTGFLASRAIGAGEGAATFGLQSAASNAGGQLGMMQTGIQKGFDTEALARETAAGAVGGLAFGALAARRAPKPEEAPPPHPDVDPAAQSALAAAGIYTTPAGPPEQLRIAGPPAMSGQPTETPPQINVPAGEGQIGPGPAYFGDVNIAPVTRGPEPPPEGTAAPPPNEPPPPPPPPGAPPGGGGVPPAAQVAVQTSQTKAPPPAGQRPSGTMKKAELNDALVGMGIDTKGMNRDDMARRFDREQARAPSTQTPDVSTVTEGPPTAPARETVPGPGAETQAAPPVSEGPSLPPAPEGDASGTKASVPFMITAAMKQELRARGHTAEDISNMTPQQAHEILAKSVEPEPTADISTGVRPEGGPASVTDERPTQATAEVTPEVKPKEDPRETAVGHLAAAKQRVLAEARANGAPVRKGSPAEKAINDAMAEMQRAFSDPKQDPGDVMKMLHTDARRGTPNEGETIAAYAARRALVSGMLKEITGNEKFKLPPLKLKEVADTRSEIEQVRAEEQQRGGEEATRKATTSEATEEKATGASETGETTGAEAVDEKLPKGTSIVVRAKKLVQQILDPQHPMDVPTAEKILAKTSNLGRPRTKGFGDLHDAFETEWKRITGEAGQKAKAKLEAELARLDRQQPMTEEGTQGRVLEEQQHDRAVAKVQKQLEEYAPERLIAMAKAMKEIADPIKDAADARDALLARKAELEGGRKYQLSGSFTPTSRPPTSDGIDPRSSRFLGLHYDPRLNDFIHRDLTASEQNGVRYTLHDALRAIINHSGVRVEMRPLWQLARMLLSRAKDVEIHTPERLLELGHIDSKEHQFLSDPGVAGAYADAQYGDPAHIVLNPRAYDTSHVQTLIHEGLHRVLNAHIENLLKTDPNHAHLQALRAISIELGKYRRELPLDSMAREAISNMQGNPHEVATYLMSSPELMSFATSKQASPELIATLRRLGLDAQPKQSVWRTFVNTARRALGMDAPKSASEYTLFDHAMRPLSHIVEHAVEYNERLLPQDPALRAQAEPLYRGLAQGFSPRISKMAERVFDNVDPKGLGARATRALLQSAPLDRIVDRFGHLSQHLAGVRNAMDKAQATGAKFLREYADKATMLANQLRGKDDVANLMNDAGYARAVLGSKDPEANAHLTTPEEHAELARLQTEFSKLPTADQELYRRTVDFNNEKYARVRAAAGNRLLNDWLPHGTDAERDVLRKAMRSRKSMEEYLKNPDNPAIDASKRAIAKGIVSLHLDGYVKGDYFPMRRHGDYIVEYGEHDTPSYGVQAFEKRSEADAFRRDALARGMDPQEVRERDSIIRNHAMRTSPVVQEMLDRINVTPELKGHADQLRDMVTKLQLQYASTGERARARRRYVAGASKDIGRALQSDTMMQGMQIGNHEHSAELTAAMEGMRQDAGTLARNGGDAFTLDQIRHELQRQIGAGDTAMYSGASGLMRKATSFGYGYSLASPSRVAVETAELLMKMQVFIGAEHGHGRALMEISRALKDISPRLWAKGMGNTAKAIIGKPLSAVDYQLSQMARERLLEVGRDRAGINALFDHMESIGLFDQTKAQSMKELARSTNIGKAFNWFLEVSSAMSHASEESNRIAGTVAAFRAARSKGVSIPDAIKSAENALRKAPNFAPHNKPRIATERGPLGRFGAPIMQFKMFGFNEYWTMANLARDILARNTDPVKRKEAIYGLTGVLMQHALMAGVLTWYADPARYIGGAWDILTGQTPHDHTLAMRKWLSDSIGPTWGEILGRGAPHAVGWDLRTRSGAENLLNVPTMNGFTPKDWALFMGEAAMGASGSDAANVVSGISHMIHGDYLQGIKEILPRLLRDPVKAYDLYDRGLIDSRGKPMLSRDKISGWNVASQALGFVPANVADAREGRQAIQEKEQGENDRKTRLTQKYVSAAPADRPAIWAQIQQFNADPANRSIRINRDQLLQQINQRRKITTQPGAFGLQLPKNRAKELMKAGSFASNVL